MTKLSDLLKLYIQNSGCTIYSLAKQSGVNRTTIQKALTEGRIPQKEAFLKLMNCLNLTSFESQKLKDSYEIAEMGEQVFLQRRYIKQLLESVSISQETENKVYGSFQDTRFTLRPCSPRLYTNKYQIAALISTLIDDELLWNPNPLLYMSLPFSAPFFDQLFQCLNRCQSSPYQITQLINFIKNPFSSEDCNYNLSILSCLLPHVLNNFGHYSIYYNYCSQIPEKEDRFGFPCYILFSKYILLLSADFTAAWLESNPELLSYYRQSFIQSIAQAHPLCHQCQNLYGSASYPADSVSLIEPASQIEYTPSFLPSLSTYLLKSDLAEDNSCKKLICRLTDETNLRSSPALPTAVFHPESLREFADKGIFNSLPFKDLPPVSIKDRLWLLEELAESCHLGVLSLYSVNPGKFPISRNISLHIHGTHEFILYLYDTMKQNCYQISISENTLNNSMQDFFSYLLTTDWICSKENTLLLIEDLICKTKSQLLP